MTEDDYGDDPELLVNTTAQGKLLLYKLVQVTASIGFYVNANWSEPRSFKQDISICTLSGKFLKLQFHIPG